MKKNFVLTLSIFLLLTVETVQNAQAQVVINEIDYDQSGTDTAEFFEIHNISTNNVDLGLYRIELVNGVGGGATIYNTINLPSTSLAAGDYFVVCANATTVDNCDLDASPDTNFIQNGAPDAIALIQGGSIIDTVSYEGNSGAPYTKGSGTGLIDDPDSGSEGLSRCPNGVDSHQYNIDFSSRPITPGAENLCEVSTRCSLH